MKQPPPPKLDRAALAGMSDDAIAAKTGRSWQDWVRVLDADGAASMPHRDIAALVHERHRVGDWWAQTVTVVHTKLRDRAASDEAKHYWTDRLDALASLFAASGT